MTLNAYTRVRNLKFKLTKHVLAIIFKLHVLVPDTCLLGGQVFT